MNEKKPMNQQKKKTSGPFQVWDVPNDLKARFKATCARKGITMRKAIVKFMEAQCQS